MRSYFYDLHLHSCLSPCADEDMTPANLAGMLKLAGIEIAALTDHNTCQNCPAFFSACHAYGILPVAGMELTTAEEIHLVCLFETLEDAQHFENEVRAHRMQIANRPDLFGAQTIRDENDRLIGEEPLLLAAATDLALEDAAELVHRHRGACFPAHIDRESGGIIAILGTLPSTPAFAAAEVRDPAKIPELSAKHILPPLLISSSDSHFLTGIPDACATLELDGKSEDEIRKNLIDRFRF